MLLVAVAAIVVGLRFNDQLVGLTGDNATYILLARDLVTGKPYENAGYPWGYPTLLAPIVAIAGSDNLLAAIPWLKLLTIAFFLLSIPLMYALFRTRHGILASVAPVMLFAVNAGTLYYANDVMSEMPYICVSFGALLYWQKAITPWASGSAPGKEKGLPLRKLLLAGLLLAAPYYLRTVGVALLGAPVVLLLVRRRIRAAGVLALGLALAALPWLLWSRSGTLNNYSNQFLMRDPYNPSLGSISSPLEMLGRVAGGLRLYIAQIFPNMLLPEPTRETVLFQLAPVLALLAVGGLALWLVRGVELPEIYALSFLLVIAIWPWTGDRFLLPIYPLLLHYMISGSIWLYRHFPRPPATSVVRPPAARNGRWAVVLLLALLALPNLYFAGEAGAQNLSYLRGEAPVSGHTPDWIEYFAACSWLKEHTPPDAVVMSRKTTLTQLYADRPSIQIALMAPRDYPSYIKQNNIDYVLEDAFPWSTHTTNYLRPALRALPGMFKLVYQGGQPTTRIWRVIR